MLVIRDTNLFDSISGQMLPHRTIVTSGERIGAVGTPEQPAEVPAGAREIYGTGKYVIPGLIDGHVHLMLPLDAACVTGDEILPMWIANGVTAVRGVGDGMAAQKLVQRFAEANPTLAPRVFMASLLADGSPPFHPSSGIAITDPEEVPAFVDEMVGWGVTTLKLYVGIERAVAKRLIDEGHRRGLVVAVHLGGYAALDAVRDGVDCIEHIWGPLSAQYQFAQPELRATPDADFDVPSMSELIAALVECNVMVCPTLTIFRNMFLQADLPEVYRHRDNDHIPGRLKRNWETCRAGMESGPDSLVGRTNELRCYQKLTGILYRAGVTVLAGTDSPEPYCPPGGSLHQELELLVGSGIGPAGALQAATINNARALKQADNLGSIEAGKLADMVVLDANPLEDIGNTRRISNVIRGGAVCDLESAIKAVPAE